METREFEREAKRIIKDFYWSKDVFITDEDMFTVWYCKTLQNNKILISTRRPDTRYFELTYNGDKDEIYFDSYIKEMNKCFKGNV